MYVCCVYDVVKGSCKEGRSECWAENSMGWNVYAKSGMNISKVILTVLKYRSVQSSGKMSCLFHTVILKDHEEAQSEIW